jgi:hypothetical protein
MYHVCGVNLNQFISWGDNQNIFEENNLLCLQCRCNKSLAFFFLSFSSCQISQILQMHCWSCGSYSLHSVSYCGKHLGNSNICLCLLLYCIAEKRVVGYPSLQATLECLSQISSIIVYHKNKPISEFDYFL